MRKFKKITVIAYWLSYTVVQFGCREIRVKNYYLPKNFVGNVAVIYSNKKSPEKEVYDYVIPDNGILVADDFFYEGNYRIYYQQKNQSGSYDTLVYMPTVYSKGNTEKLKVYNDQVITFRKGDINVVYTATSFYVGKEFDSTSAKEILFFQRKLENILLNGAKE